MRLSHAMRPITRYSTPARRAVVVADRAGSRVRGRAPAAIAGGIGGWRKETAADTE
jgi:hypothetical protein